MLSYRNQFDHPLLNRYLVEDTLNQLSFSAVKRNSGTLSREEQYQQLLSKTDDNSELERIVLTAIYDRGLKLPDDAQVLFTEANCKPDFVYKDAKLVIFCDGSVHDSIERQQQDRLDRESLEKLGYQVFVIRYNEDLEAKLNELSAWI